MLLVRVVLGVDLAVYLNNHLATPKYKYRKDTEPFIL